MNFPLNSLYKVIKMGIILDYAYVIGFYLIAYLVLNFLLEMVFNLIQIPFAFISRTAVYALFLIKTYIISLYFAFCTFACVNAGLSQIPLFIIFSFVLFADNTSRIKAARDNSEMNYHFISAIISIILFFVIFFNRFFYGKEILLKYFSIVETFLKLPIIGDITNYFLPLFSFIIVCGVVFQMIFALIALVANIKKGEKL